MASLKDRLKNAISRRSAPKEVNISKSWFAAQLQDFSVYSARKESDEKIYKRGEKTKQAPSNESMIGKIAIFYYDPKYKQTLPFYDRFPMSIIVGPAKGGFAGLNLHYLPPVLRASFLDNLLDIMNSKTITNDSKFAVTYDLLKASTKYKYFKPCYKHYLASNVRSQVKIIPPGDWIRTVFLESSIFVKASRKEVYSWSRSKI